MRKKILIILMSVYVFSAFYHNYSQAAGLDDLNSDGKKDFSLKFNSDNPLSSKRGENYEYAEFDTNFDGNMDIIAKFGFPFGSLKRDFNFDGKFDTEYLLVHVRPISANPTSWLGRLDTWHVISLSTGIKDLLGYLIDAYAVAEKNYIAVIKESIKNGADINAKDANGDTLLMRVVKSGYLEAAEFLTANGANVNARNNEDVTVLMQAVQRGFPQLARIRILMEEDNIQRDNPQMVKLLIGKGAYVNAKSKDSQTALTLAIKKGYLETTNLLLSSGADINAKNNDGLTPLMQAIKRKYNSAAYFDMINLLIKNKADVNAQENSGQTVLMVAMQKDYSVDSLNLARLLIEKGADINARADDGSTVLMQVVKRPEFGFADIAKMLIKRGADISATNNAGSTVLMAAVQSGNSEMPIFLIEKGADINAKDNEGIPALIQMGRKGDFNMAWLLLHSGADNDARDVNGDTVLMQFIKGGYPDQAQSLVMEGLAINVKNKEGMTPLMCAVEKNYLKLADVMLAKDVDIKMQDNNGQTAFDIAQKIGNSEMVSLIKQYRIRQMQLYRNEKYAFEIKALTDRPPSTREWLRARNPDMPRRLWEADFFDTWIGVSNSNNQTTEIPAIKATVNECLPQQNIDSCLQMTASDCGTVPYGELIVTYNNESLRVSQTSLLGLPARKLRVSCIKNAVYEGVAILRENRLYTFMFLTAFESAMIFSTDLVDLMISTIIFDSDGKN